jgi:hypothetical protein
VQGNARMLPDAGKPHSLHDLPACAVVATATSSEFRGVATAQRLLGAGGMKHSLALCTTLALLGACVSEPDASDDSTVAATDEVAGADDLTGGFHLPSPSTQATDGRTFALNAPLFPQSLLAGVEPRQQFKLQTGPVGTRGKTVMLPFTYTGSGFVAIGTADAAKLRAILAPHGLEPLPLERYPLLPVIAPTPEAQAALAGRAMVEIYGNNYELSSAGPIAPGFVVAYVINPRDPAGDIGMVFLDYFASTPMALAFGIEAWGTMKRLADTQASFAGADRGFRVSYQGQRMLTMKLVNADARLSPETPSIHSVSIAITPRSGFGPGQTFNRNETIAKLRVAAFDPAQDTFETAGFLKRNLDAMDFRGPLVWGTSRDFEGIYHTDLAQVPSHARDRVTDGSDPSRREF